jgi:hypothetical protein
MHAWINKTMIHTQRVQLLNQNSSCMDQNKTMKSKMKEKNSRQEEE